VEVQVTAGDSKKSIEVADTLLDTPYREGLVHQLVTAYLAGARQGTKAQKTRAEVRGGGAKPWRQKGTGRARAGTIRSPIWRTGGVTFAAKPRSYEQKINRKMYRAGMRSIISELLRQERLQFVEKIELANHRTQDFLKQLQQWHCADCKLAIIADLDELDSNLVLASRNLHRVLVILPSEVNPHTLVNADQVIMTEAALRALEEQWS